MSLLEQAKKRIRFSISDEVLKILSEQAKDLNLCLRRATATFGTGTLRPSLPTKPGIIRCAGKEFAAPVPYYKEKPHD